jgi:hypothetical protein
LIQRVAGISGNGHLEPGEFHHDANGDGDVDGGEDVGGHSQIAADSPLNIEVRSGVAQIAFVANSTDGRKGIIVHEFRVAANGDVKRANVSNDRVIQIGDSIPGFDALVDDLRIYRGLNRHGLVAFLAELADGNSAVIKAIPDPPSVLNVVTHGFGNKIDDLGLDPSQITLFRDFLVPFTEMGEALDAIPNPESAIAGKIATYVANWPSSDGWIPALAKYIASVAYGALGKVTKAAKELVKAELSKKHAESHAMDAARTIVDELLANGLLSTPQATHNGAQRIHLIGHSRGAAVNAQVAKILDSMGYNIDQYTALDGYSKDWPHGSSILADIDIVATLLDLETPIRRKVNYRVERGATDAFSSVVSDFIRANPQLLSQALGPLGPATLSLLAAKLVDWRAPYRFGFDNYLLDGSRSVQAPSAHINLPGHVGAVELYATSAARTPLQLRYILDNYAGEQSGKQFERPPLEPVPSASAQQGISAALATGFSNLIDGSFEELGQLMQDPSEFESTGDPTLDAWVKLSELPSELLKTTWDVTGSATIKTQDENSYVELQQGPGSTSSIGQILILDSEVDRLEFDLSAVSRGVGDRLDIVFQGSSQEHILGTFDLTAIAPSGRYSVPLSDVADRHGLVEIRLAGPESEPAIIHIDNLGVYLVDALTGDYNANGEVDTTDYVLWRKSLGSTSDLRADGNGNAVVDQADYDVWRANFRKTAESADVGPTAVDDEAFTSVGLPVTVKVLANDTSPDGPLNLGSVAITQQPANGTLSNLSATGEVRYTPNAGFAGEDSFRYTVKDTNGNESNAATVTVSVLAVNSLLGDLNGDGNLTSADLEAFDLGILSRALFRADFPNVDPDKVGDLNGDKVMNAQDRPLLVELFTSAYRPDRFEPNDTFELASNLGTVDSRIEPELTIHLPGNNDYYQFLAAKTGPAQIDLLFEHAAGDLDLILYDAARQQIASSESLDDDERITLDLEENQRYYARIAPKTGVTHPDYDFVIADAVAPTLVSIDPADQAIRPAGLESIRIHFSEPIQAGSATDAVFQLKSVLSGNVVPLTIQQAGSGKTVLLAFAQLPAGEYQLTIDTAAVKDLSGTPVAGPPIVSRFTTVAATIHWANQAGGSWHNANNWSPARLPGSADNVLINIPADVTITFDQGTATINSLYSANSFRLMGGTLTVRTFLQVDGDFTLGGGSSEPTLIGATIRPGIRGAEVKLIDTKSATFDGVTLDANMLVEHQSTLTVRNNLTVNGILTVRKRSGDKEPEPYADTSIVLDGNQQILGKGEVFMSAPMAPAWSNLWISQSNGSMLSIGPDLTIHGGPYGFVARGTLDNQGTLLINGTLSASVLMNNGVMGVIDGLLNVLVPDITNKGSIETRGQGQVFLHEDPVQFANTGRIDARGGGKIYIRGDKDRFSWTSTGLIRAVENSEVHMHASYRLSGTTFDARGGSVVSYGVWDNRNETRMLNAATGSITVAGGTVLRGRFIGADGQGLILIGGTLNGVTLDVDLTVLSGTAGVLDGVTINRDLTVLPGTRLTIRNGLTLNGTATLEIEQGISQDAWLLFSGVGALTGTGEVVAMGSAAPVGPNPNNQYGSVIKPAPDGSELRVGPDITIRGSLLLGDAARPGRVINEGKIAGNGGWVQIWATEFENLGTVEISGANNVLQPQANMTINRGRFVARNGGELHLLNSTRWEDGARLDNEGGKIAVAGVLDITREPLTFTGDVTLIGTIRGGTIPETNGILKPIGTTPVLDGVTVDADMRVGPGRLTIRNGLTLNGTATLAQESGPGFLADTRLLFSGTGGLNGTGDVIAEGGAYVFGGQYGSTLAPALDSSELRIGPGITIRGSFHLGDWQLRRDNPTKLVRIVNEGTLAGFGGQVQIWATEFENSGTVEISGLNGLLQSHADLTINRGRLVARDSAELQLQNSARWEKGARLDNEGGKIAIAAVLDISQEPLAFTGEVIFGGTIRGGIVTSENGLLVSQGGMLDGITLNADMRVDWGGRPLTVVNTLTLNDSKVTFDPFLVPPNQVESRIEFSNMGVLNGRGQLLFHPGGASRITPVGAGSSLRIGPGITIRGSGIVGDPNLPLWNEGVILAQGHSNATLLVRASRFDNDGVVSLDGLGTLQFQTTATHNNHEIGARNAGASITLFGETTNTGLIFADEGARVTVGNATNFSNGTLQGGTWRVGSGSTMRLNGATVTTLDAAVILDGANSALTTGENTVFALAGLTAIAERGELSLLAGRDITTAGALQNAGRLSLGAGSVVTVNGTYTQSATGTFDVSIADGGNSGRIAATNMASLSGDLIISPAPGFIPSSGSTFEILSASAINREFAQEQFAGFDPGLQLQVAYSSTSVSVQATRLYPLGDADQDGDADQADYGVWRATFGSSDRRADFNGNGIIDGVDYVLWRNALIGAANSASLSAVAAFGAGSADSRAPSRHDSDNGSADVVSATLGVAARPPVNPAVVPSAFDQAFANWMATPSSGRLPRIKQLSPTAANGHTHEENDLLLNISLNRREVAAQDRPLKDQGISLRVDDHEDDSRATDDFFAEVGEHPNDLSAEIAALHE